MPARLASRVLAAALSVLAASDVGATGDRKSQRTHGSGDPVLESIVRDEMRIRCDDDRSRATRYLLRDIDLDDNGTAEAVVYVTGPDVCGTGGCTLLVLRRAGSRIAVDSRLTLVQIPVAVGPRAAKGWKSLVIGVGGGGVAGSKRIVTRGEKAYVASPTLAEPVGADASSATLFDENALADTRPLCTPANPDLLPGERLGSLRIGMDGGELVNALGEPQTKDGRAICEVDALEHETWRWPDAGVTVDVRYDTPTPRVASIRIGKASGLRTSRGIGIGAAFADVARAYARETVPSATQEPMLLTAGTEHEGIAFSFENGLVSQIFIGSLAE